MSFVVHAGGVPRERAAWCTHDARMWQEDDGYPWCPCCSIVEALRVGNRSTWGLARGMDRPRPVVRGWLRYLEKTGEVEQVGIVPFADAPTQGVAIWRLNRR